MINVSWSAIYNSMVRIQMSVRLYPPPRGIAQQTGIRLDYPPSWARMPLSFQWAWKRVIQEVKKPRVEWVLQTKRDLAVCIELGALCWVVGGHVIKVINEWVYCRWWELSRQQEQGPPGENQLISWEEVDQLWGQLVLVGCLSQEIRVAKHLMVGSHPGGELGRGLTGSHLHWG